MVKIYFMDFNQALSLSTDPSLTVMSPSFDSEFRKVVLSRRFSKRRSEIGVGDATEHLS